MKQCQICGKGSSLGGKRIKLRGHYNPQPLTRKHPNLQKTALPTGERVLACTQCIKTLAKNKRG